MVDLEPFDTIPPDDEPQKFWTTGRILYAIIAIIVIIAFLTLMLWPTILAITQQPTPVPTTPLPRVSLSGA